MLGWLFPRCPLDTADKAWVERRMLWLAGRFGIDRLRNARVILPTDEFFPADYTPDEDGASACLVRLCEYMGVDPFAVRLTVVPDEQMHGVAGLYEQRARSTIYVAQSQLEAPNRLIATLAHELAHELLLKGGHLTAGERDHELVTDLLPVFLGTGILIANATVMSQSVRYGNENHWVIGQQGYLSSITLGYALALFAFVRGEIKPAWRRHLRWDARSTLQSGLRFLRRTGDSLFRSETVETAQESPSTAITQRRLSDPSATVRLAALWDIDDHGLTDPELAASVAARMEDTDAEVRRVAVATLGRFGMAAAKFRPQLAAFLHLGTLRVQAAAAVALAGIGVADSDTLQAIIGLVGHPDGEVAATAARALGRLGSAATTAIPRLLELLEWAGGVGEPDRLDVIAGTLRTVTPDALALVREYFAGRDPNVRRIVLQAFAGRVMRPPKVSER